MAESTNREEKTEIAHLRQLSALLDSARQNGEMTDITLVCADKEFHAHRLVLAPVSPYFQSTWGSEWKEPNIGRYELPAMGPEIVDSILSFVYTGKLKDASMASNKDTMIRLLEAADYFQIENLIEYCFQTISDLSLRVDNFMEMYFLAEKFNNLRQIAHIEEVLSPNFNEMSQTEDFLQLNKDQLRSLLLYPKVDQSNMDKVFTALLQWIEFESKTRNDSFQGFLEILDQHWCSKWLEKLITKNISDGLWNSSTIAFLRESATSRDSIVAHNHPANDNPGIHIVCFGDGHVMSIYDVEKDDWLPSKKLPFHLDYRMAVVGYRRHIYLVGGEREQYFSPSNTVIEYCPFTNTVKTEESGGLLFPVYNAGAGVFNDFIYVVNGVDKEYEELLSVQCYDPHKGTCCEVASTLRWRRRPFVFSFSDRLHVFGASAHNEKSLERYDSVADQWTDMTDVTGVHDYMGSYHVTFCCTKLYCLSERNFENQFIVFDLLSEKLEIINFQEGPECVCALWSSKYLEKDFLLAMGFSDSLYFYDVEAGNWIKYGVWNTDDTLRFYHWLSCCI